MAYTFRELLHMNFQAIPISALKLAELEPKPANFTGPTLPSIKPDQTPVP
jgi:hypothetical protein